EKDNSQSGDNEISEAVTNAAGALEPVPNADEISAMNVTEASEAAKINGILYAYPMTQITVISCIMTKDIYLKAMLRPLMVF
ncbi:MAG: hypothetical protein MSJ26_01360, partial [Oscillospiraceae bacterium]|nr:hypothetical protein [Oscillospiraceae bacterium]